MTCGGGSRCPNGPRWAAGNGLGSGNIAAGTYLYVDVSSMVTNAPDLFNIATGFFGSQGLEVLKPGVYRIFHSMEFNPNPPPVPAENYSAIMVNDYANWYHRTDHSFTRGYSIGGGLGYPADNSIYLAWLDVVVVSALVGGLPFVVGHTPYNVVEFGLTHNTGVFGNYSADFYIYELPSGAFDVSLFPPNGDFTGLTYLP